MFSGSQANGSGLLSNQGGGFDSSMFGGGLTGLIGGLFGNSGAPYSDAMDQYNQWTNKAQNVQNPFLNAGNTGMGNYQHWLQGMQNPSQFMNHLMGQYQESPWAKYQQQQAMRANTNMASASGLTGSTPFQLQGQQNASNISSQDMNNWLQNVLGINTQYGAGQQNLMQGGQNAANALTGMYGNAAPWMGEQSYNKGAAGNNDMWNMLGGGAEILSSFL